MTILSRFITDSTGKVNLRKMFDHFYVNGINILEDIRFNSVLQTISPTEEGKPPWEESYAVRMFGDEIAVNVLEDAIKQSPTFKQFLLPEFQYTIRNFKKFKTELEDVFEHCKSENSGEITTYIPSLSEYHHDKWAVSFCSVDGQIANLGDFSDMFTIQSVTKPLLYGKSLNTSVGNLTNCCLQMHIYELLIINNNYFSHNYDISLLGLSAVQRILLNDTVPDS